MPSKFTEEFIKYFRRTIKACFAQLGEIRVRFSETTVAYSLTRLNRDQYTLKPDEPLFEAQQFGPAKIEVYDTEKRLLMSYDHVGVFIPAGEHMGMMSLSWGVSDSELILDIVFDRYMKVCGFWFELCTTSDGARVYLSGGMMLKMKRECSDSPPVWSATNACYFGWKSSAAEAITDVLNATRDLATVLRDVKSMRQELPG